VQLPSMPLSFTNDKQKAGILPKGFSPGPDHVIIGRGRRCVNHEGNQRLRKIVKAELKSYVSACSKIEKSAILLRVMRQVKRSNKDNIGFVKQDLNTGRWSELSDSASRVAVAQTFRDASPGRGYRSSRQSKQQRRRIERLNSMLRHSLHSVHQAMTVNNGVSVACPLVPNVSPSSQMIWQHDTTSSLQTSPSPFRGVLSNACSLLQQQQNCRSMGTNIMMGMPPNFCHSQQMDPCTMQHQLPVMQQQMTGYMGAGSPSPGPYPFSSPTVELTDELLHLESFAGISEAACDEATENDDDSFLDVFHSISLPNLRAALLT
jgi:hypothetical protein